MAASTPYRLSPIRAGIRGASVGIAVYLFILVAIPVAFFAFIVTALVVLGFVLSHL